MRCAAFGQGRSDEAALRQLALTVRISFAGRASCVGAASGAMTLPANSACAASATQVETAGLVMANPTSATMAR
jgi:hypothetical protein